MKVDPRLCRYRKGVPRQISATNKRPGRASVDEATQARLDAPKMPACRPSVPPERPDARVTDESSRARKPTVPRAGMLLAVDAWIDSTVYEAGFKIGETWEDPHHLLPPFPRHRLAARRSSRFSSEGFTLGAAGSVVMLALAMPAFEETDRQLAHAGRFRRHLPRPPGQRDRPARHHPARFRAGRRDARPCHQGRAGHRGPPLLRALRHRLPRAGRAPCRKTCAPIRSCRAARASPSSWPRTCSSPTSAPSSARSRKPSWPSGWRANLSKKEILQLYLDRAYMGGGTFGIAAAADFYFGKEVKDLEPRRGGHAGGPVQGAGEIRAARQPAGRARPRQRRAHQSGRRAAS